MQKDQCYRTCRFAPVSSDFLDRVTARLYNDLSLVVTSTMEYYKRNSFENLVLRSNR